MTSVAFSPDGTRIVTAGGGGAGKPGEVKVWDAEKGGKALLELKGNSTTWRSNVSFSPDGTRILTGSGHLTKVVDARSGAVLLELQGYAPPSYRFDPCGRPVGGGRGAGAASFSPDGTRIVTAGGARTVGEVKVWDARTGTELLDLKGHTAQVLSASFSPDGMRIVTGSADGTVKLWDAWAGTGRLELGEHPAEVSSLSISPDGTQIVTAYPRRDGDGVGWARADSPVQIERGQGLR